MAIWLLVILFSYFFFSVAAFGDKLLLSGFTAKEVEHKESDPILYAFSVGLLNILVVALIPLVGIHFPPVKAIAWIILEALTMVLSLYFLYSSVQKFEVSKVIPVIGALQPIFVFLLSFLLFGTVLLQPFALFIFGLLIAGSMLISFERKFHATKKLLILSATAALLFSLEYVFSKLVFIHMDFLPGLIWMRIASFAFSLLFLFNAQLRRRIFFRKEKANRKTAVGFVIFQAMGAMAGLLQNWAVALVPIGFLAIMNSLRGVQYLFLFIITLGFSYFLPAMFSEAVSSKALAQKGLGILLIVIALGFLVV